MGHPELVGIVLRRVLLDLLLVALDRLLDARRLPVAEIHGSHMLRRHRRPHPPRDAAVRPPWQR
jgi:hypothetical protein